MARIASITHPSNSTQLRPDLTLLGWLLMLTVLIAAALLVENDAPTNEDPPGVQSVGATSRSDGRCLGDDLRARMCKVATEGGLTAGIQY